LYVAIKIIILYNRKIILKVDEQSCYYEYKKGLKLKTDVT